jgi:hypothetical protein
MTTTANTFTDAPSPFDDPNADIIVRSSENVDFRMYKFLLALASPFFKEMFEIPQPMNIDGGEKQRFQSDDTRDGIPVIFMHDDQNQVCGKDVVEFVLSSCHPVCLQPQLLPEVVGPVIHVAIKYRMDSVVKKLLHDPHLLKAKPFLVFAHACHVGLAAEAAVAAKETLRFRIEDFPREPTLKLISGYQYHALLEFHRRCGKEASAIARGNNAVWMPNEILRLFPDSHEPCSSSENKNINLWNTRLEISTHIFLVKAFTGGGNSNPVLSKRVVPNRRNIPNSSSQQWWIEYMASTATALESRPHSSTVNDTVRVGETLTKAFRSCETCADHVGSLMSAFIPAFKQKIEKVICTVSLSCSFCARAL